MLYSHIPNKRLWKIVEELLFGLSIVIVTITARVLGNFEAVLSLRFSVVRQLILVLLFSLKKWAS